jgi:hypothetical protein
MITAQATAVRVNILFIQLLLRLAIRHPDN